MKPANIPGSEVMAVLPLDVPQRAPFREWTPHDWALQILSVFGCFQSAENKAWTLDQVARVLHGTEVIPGVAVWCDGRTEQRFWLAPPSHYYLKWRQTLQRRMGRKWLYDEGVAPQAVNWEGWLPLFSSHLGHSLRSSRPSVQRPRSGGLLS